MGNARSQRRALEKRRAAVARQPHEPALPPAAPPGPGQMMLGVEFEEHRLYSGPIPHAEELGNYEGVLPGLADRIVTMAERQAKHRRRLETIDVVLEHLHVSFGQISALAVAIFFGWVAWSLGQDGRELLAAFIGAVDLVALVSVFIYGKRQEAAGPPTQESPARRS